VKVIWLRRPRAKFVEAVQRIANDDAGAGRRQFDEVEKQVNRLAERPKMGRRSRSRPGTRVLRIVRTRFVIAYRILPRAERIEIFRFAHVRQRSDG
jgi:plasmid stabilization system protein ParE